MIEFDIEWYGAYNRRSALCDYLELLALQDKSIGNSELADMIRDAGWTTRLNDLIVDNSDEEPDGQEETGLSESLDEADIASEDVLAILRQRKDILGEYYPFHMDSSHKLMKRDGSDIRATYLAYLTITVCHTIAWISPELKEAIPHKPFDVFEMSLAKALNSCGISTALIADYRQNNRDFPETFSRACNSVGLTASLSSAPYRKSAIDEGIDTLSNLWPKDTRVGGIQFIGQATCASSNEWRAKLHEAPVGLVQEWLGRGNAPVPFLSVPHHIQQETLNYLINIDGRRDVLDRLRLSLIDRELLSEEQELIDALIAMEVEHIA